jgi:predicted RNase H-like nuclease (RuvC/YqgF family)
MSRLPPRTYPPTPPNIYLPDKTYEYPETPGPTRARVNNLQSQVSELVRKEHAAKRRHESETAGLQATIQSLQSQLKNSGDSKKAIECKDREIARMQQEGESMREEVSSEM